MTAPTFLVRGCIDYGIALECDLCHEDLTPDISSMSLTDLVRLAVAHRCTVETTATEEPAVMIFYHEPTG